MNSFYNGTSCTCYQGYILVNGNCYTICGPNAFVNNSQCQCIPGYSFSFTLNQCTQQQTITCGRNFVLINNVCICPTGFGLINNLCLVCPANSFVDNSGLCACTSGYSLSSSTLSCVQSCFENAYRNNLGQCICKDGYYNQGNACIQSSNCQGGSYWNGATCVCPNGQFIDSIIKQCTYCNTPDRAVVGSNCVCSPVHYPTINSCLPCPSNSYYNSTTQNCVCLPGYILINGQCVTITNCPSNSNWNSTSNQCQCVYQGQYVINGFCQSCQPNSSWNGAVCLCNQGFTLSNSLCIVSCKENSNWNGISCICNSGFNLIGGNCVLCDSHSTYSTAQLTCLCNAGYYGNFSICNLCDGTCATCSGPTAAQCLSCKGNNILSNGVCHIGSCPASYFIDSNNQCVSCISNCILCYTSSSCVTCASGYALSTAAIGGTIVITCAKIPTGTNSTLSFRGRVVGNNVLYQGVAMSLMPTAILTNNCDICNNLLKINIVSTFATITYTLEYITNSQYWFLITFNFGGVAFIPSF